MKQVTSAEVQKNFGSFKRAALQEPVTIGWHGKPLLVVMSVEHYENILRGQPVSVQALHAAAGLALNHAHCVDAPRRPVPSPVTPQSPLIPAGKTTLPLRRNPVSQAELEALASKPRPRFGSGS